MDRFFESAARDVAPGVTNSDELGREIDRRIAAAPPHVAAALELSACRYRIDERPRSGLDLVPECGGDERAAIRVEVSRREEWAEE